MLIGIILIYGMTLTNCIQIIFANEEIKNMIDKKNPEKRSKRNIDSNQNVKTFEKKNRLIKRFDSIVNGNYSTNDNLFHMNQFDWLSRKSKPRYQDEIVKRQQVTIQMIYEINECKYGHNKLRILHQVNPLNWHDELAHSSEEYALHLATQNNGAQHSSFYDEQGRKYGENLYWYKGGVQKNCHDAIFLWYQEHEGLGYGKENNLYASGHFIQLVWKETKHVGVGIAFAHDQTWIVARYFPASNTAVEHIGYFIKESRYAEAKIDPSDLISVKPRPKIIQSIQVMKHGVSSCENKDIYCDYYKSIGYCYYESIQMQCQLACGECEAGRKVDGKFTGWVKTEACSTDCGVGTLREHRYCSNPEPVNGGSKCRGISTRTTNCTDHRCLNDKMDCRDLHRDCLGYMKLGYCFYPIYQPFMKLNCKTSCGLCSGCRDNYENYDCSIYATEMNYCNDEVYGPFMKENCQLACCEYARFFLTSGYGVFKEISDI